MPGKLTTGSTDNNAFSPMASRAFCEGMYYRSTNTQANAPVTNVPTSTGATLVTNGTFAADSDWTKGTGWTISAGVASSDGTQVADALLTTSTVPAVKTGLDYLLVFTVSAYTAGNVALQFQGAEVIADKAATGTYSTVVTATSATGTIDVVADATFVGSVDNVVLLPIDGEEAAAWIAGWQVAQDAAGGTITRANQGPCSVVGSISA